jgi:nucleoside-diphosphate-sugar epimerase/SAM-dependent methyltransferase
VEALLAEGQRVVAWVDPSRPRQPWDENLVQVIAAPLPEADAPLPAMPTCDACVLANALEPDDGPSEDLSRIAEKRYRVAERLVSHVGATRFILVSSIEVAGPLTPSEGEQYESHAPSPNLHSGGALQAIETHSLYLARERGVTTVILRAGHVYGGGDPGFLLPALDLLQHSDLERLRQEWANHRFHPLHIADLAMAVVRSVQKGSGIYHITGTEQPTVGDILRTLERVARKRGMEVPALKSPLFSNALEERVHYRYPAERARSELGWRPRRELEAAVVELADRTAVDRQFVTRRTQASGGIEDWMDDARLRRALTRPVRTFAARALRVAGARRVLMLGCADADIALWLASTQDLQVLATDLSEAAVHSARAAAAARGLSAKIRFERIDPTTLTGHEPFDALCILDPAGATALSPQEVHTLMQRTLKPDGILISAGPHCIEGHHPRLSRVMSACFGSWLARAFDEKSWRRAIVRERTRGFSMARRDGTNRAQRHQQALLLESPRTESYAHFLAPFVANAFVVHQRWAWVRGLVRAGLPLLMLFDGWLCRFPLPKSWAALGLRVWRSGPEARDVTPSA